ncbi:MAG: hypothetical protein PHT16_01440 [Candidatus Pacebacteria bacterium]|nr:hypothetical protein [Candidatus Paceibacterota bacterium]
MKPKHRIKVVIVNDKFQKGYRYEISEPVGRNFHSDFKPELTPKKMLKLGVFGGKYMTDCRREFPKSWFIHAKLSPKHHDDTLNYFHKHASQPLKVWEEKGWINEEHDPRGWFQWYGRYYMGRRLPDEDERQIKRWKAIRRHVAQIVKNCRVKDLACRPGQRQALLHWAYDSTKI